MNIFILLFALTQAQAATTEKPKKPQPMTVTSVDKDLVWRDCDDYFPPGCETAVVRSEAGPKGNTDIYFRVPPNYTIPKHWHSSEERITVLTGKMKLLSEGEAESIVTKGAYLYGPPKHPHGGYCFPGEVCLLAINFSKGADVFLGDGKKAAENKPAK